MNEPMGVLVELRSILDKWLAERVCPYCGACDNKARYRTITTREGTTFFDLVEINVMHKPDCSYTRIAAIVGRDNHQHWQAEPMMYDMDLRKTE